MSVTDPYSPPQSALGALTPAEQYARDNGELRYSRFWDRVGAGLIDFLIALPLVSLDYFFGSESRYFQLYMLIPVQIFALFMHIFMVTKYGGSPGKLLVGLRIVKLDGAPVTVKEALLRYSVLWVLSIVILAITVSAALGMSAEEYSSLSYLQRSVKLSERSHYMGWMAAAMQLWTWGGLITVLVSKKRRAPHDFIAGTVVVRK